ncbi:O-methylsterigmatocystin oxidoreductase, partial [Leucoagaricus sp. SymC.cos]
ERRRNPKGLPLSPGPKGYPIIDNLLDFPVYKPWEQHDKLSKTYGDMVYIKVFGQSFLVLGSVERANDLLKKRLSNYSDRVYMTTLNSELCLLAWNFSAMAYGPRWRHHRRAFLKKFKESMRWRQAAPPGAPHKSLKTGEYNGHYIPKGTIVLANSWTMLHDPEIYEDPFTYNPDRFLREDGTTDPSVHHPKVAFFGVGRRICPGRYFAEDSLSIIVSNVLAAFDIRPCVDKDGKEIPIKPEMMH